MLALYRAEKLLVLILSERRDEGGVIASLDSRDVADFGHLRKRERSLQHPPSGKPDLRKLCRSTSL
ncbi:hypothetical protein K402DRAFT_399287 [Aulographum hederae CBS 113979]|uniref:Uncharacterized protein n=1 Tax=Aulographum hederae CBS 113979 TaxID=1176131 RepID=A0A6G1GIM6_9PEZI|nr:hypothetical protein K402DRAFT_399295 [Aulographum hederae CBS 113979]KAF1980578.1 hypothetical protein K402DRAFT_399287 [Aulographum hederae CBS 113979]